MYRFSHECMPINTGNDILILNEIRHALIQLLEKNEPTTIDLRTIPLAPLEEARIESTLGQGEINITLNALGKSTITETAIAGVWLTTHYSTENEILGKQIEITFFPSIIATTKSEIKEGAEMLRQHLADEKKH